MNKIFNLLCLCLLQNKVKSENNEYEMIDELLYNDEIIEDVIYNNDVVDDTYNDEEENEKIEDIFFNNIGYRKLINEPEMECTDAGTYSNFVCDYCIDLPKLVCESICDSGLDQVPINCHWSPWWAWDGVPGGGEGWCCGGALPEDLPSL